MTTTLLERIERGLTTVDDAETVKLLIDCLDEILLAIELEFGDDTVDWPGDLMDAGDDARTMLKFVV